MIIAFIAIAVALLYPVLKAHWNFNYFKKVKSKKGSEPFIGHRSLVKTMHFSKKGSEPFIGHRSLVKTMHFSARL